jgi:molybdenum ABC transporter molybdate-binding protein
MRPGSRRLAQLNGMWWTFVGSAVVLVFLITLLAWDSIRFAYRVEPIVLYCAAALKEPATAAAREYEREYGVPVVLQFGGSQTLLTNAEVSDEGDLYLPADDSYIKIARDRDLIDEVLPLCRMTPILAVRKGNPLNIRSLDDVINRTDVRFGQADPRAAAVGKLTREILTKNGRWQQLHKRTTVYKLTVTDIANDLVIGEIDACVLWDALLAQYPTVERVPAPELEQRTSNVPVAVLRKSKQPTEALRFARYLAARDRGLEHFRQAGFQTEEGDLWAEKPEIRLMAGAMLKPAIDETIRAFEDREGVRVTRIYNGCGILVSQMKTGEHPDAYFSCDTSFMTQVSDLFLDSTDISSNELVIIVPKANPYRVRSLQDLGQPGLKLGVGHERKCAMGAITVQTFKQGRAGSSVTQNVVVRAPTGADLVNQLRAGALDAVIAYRSNAAACADEVECIPIDVPCAIAVQPFAIGKESDFKQLTGRLLEAIRSAASRERFKANRFEWKGS